MKRSNLAGRGGLAVVLCLTMIWSACSTAWVAQAEQIVAALIPAATNIVALVAAMQGKGVSAADLQTIQNAGSQAGADLQLVESLIATRELQERVAELEKSNSDLKAQAARMTRNTLPPMVSAILAKNGAEGGGEKIEKGVLDNTLQSLSVEQRIAVKAELARAGMIE